MGKIVSRLVSALKSVYSPCNESVSIKGDCLLQPVRDWQHSAPCSVVQSSHEASQSFIKPLTSVNFCKRLFSKQRLQRFSEKIVIAPLCLDIIKLSSPQLCCLLILSHRKKIAPSLCYMLAYM